MKLMHERDLQKREKTYLPLCLNQPGYQKTALFRNNQESVKKY
jgi:hypothetical protein